MLHLLATAGDHVDQLKHVIAGFEQHGDQLGVYRNAAFTQTIQHVFDDVSKTDDRRQPEQSGRAFDGVRCAENRADRVLVAGLAFELQKGFLHRLQKLTRFNDKRLLCLIEINTHDDFLDRSLGSTANGRATAPHPDYITRRFR